MRKKAETDSQAPALVDSDISKKAFRFELGPSDSKGLPYRLKQKNKHKLLNLKLS